MVWAPADRATRDLGRTNGDLVQAAPPAAPRTVAGMRIHLRVHGELADLAGGRDHDVPATAPRSVKDLVEAAGVPHPEVDVVLVDGVPVGFDHQVTGGEHVEVHPPGGTIDVPPPQRLWPDPPTPRRFVLDVHLGTLTRRLRLLGFDCWYRTDADDPELADVAVTQGRILLTRDRQLLMRRDVRHGYVPRDDEPDVQLTEVVDRYGLADRAAPLTRCIPCNGRLEPVAAAEVWHLLPARTREEFDTFVACVSCGKVYWPGSHLDRIAGILDVVGDPGRAPR